MPQLSLCDSGFEPHPVKTRKRLLLEQKEQVASWADLVALRTLCKIRRAACICRNPKVNEPLTQQGLLFKADVRVKVERQFGFVKVRYRGLAKNAVQLTLETKLPLRRSGIHSSSRCVLSR